MRLDYLLVFGYNSIQFSRYISPVHSRYTSFSLKITIVQSDTLYLIRWLCWKDIHGGIYRQVGVVEERQEDEGQKPVVFAAEYRLEIL